MRVVAVILLTEDHRFLIARKKPGKPLSGYWEFPGGKVEPGETPESALVREIKEELNVDIYNLKEYCSYDYQKEKRVLEFTFFTASGNTENLLLSDHDQVAWITFEELASYALAPADMIAADIITEKKFQGSAYNQT